MLHVIATIEIAAGQRDAFLAEFRKLVPLVRAEVGCLEYGPAVDLPSGIPVQIPVRENVVTVVEKWEGLAALQTHLTASHMATFRERTKGMVVKLQLQVLQPA